MLANLTWPQAAVIISMTIVVGVLAYFQNYAVASLLSLVSATWALFQDRPGSKS